MEQPIYSRPKAPTPKTIALEFLDDHMPTDPPPALNTLRGRDRRYLSPWAWVAATGSAALMCVRNPGGAGNRKSAFAIILRMARCRRSWAAQPAQSPM
jgi:hypothetical protein